MFYADHAQNPIAILATAKTGNLWIKHVLANAFSIASGDFFQNQEILTYFLGPKIDRRIIFHAHVGHSAALQRTLNENQVKIISLVRNPLDVFLSLRNHIARVGPNSPAQAQILSEDPETLRGFAQTYFLGDLAISSAWARRGAILVRYEDLLSDPIGGFKKLGRELGVREADLTQFAEYCAQKSDISDIRSKANPKDQGHFTTAEIDKWKRSENQNLIDNLRQSTAIKIALRLWGYD